MISDSPDIQFLLQAVTTGMRLSSRLEASGDWDTLVKHDASPVTVADFAVQAVTAALLAKHNDGDVLVAEESSAALRLPENAHTLAAILSVVKQVLPEVDAEKLCAWIDRGASEPGERFWVMDPIDGTKGFVRGGQYVVALARVENGDVVMSALGCPHLNQQLQPDRDIGGSLLVAARGEGSWIRPSSGKEWRRLHVSTQSDARKARITHSFEPSHLNQDLLDALLDTLGTNVETLPMDSQAKYAMLSGGASDLLYRLTSTGRPPGAECIWDHAAGALIVEEAGGCVTDLHGEPLDFTQGKRLAANTGVLVSNGLLHQAALDAYRRVTGEAG